MSLANVIFPTGSYTVYRTTAGTYDGDGRLISGTMSSFPIIADVQPSNLQPAGDSLRDLPEGMRTEEVKVVYTATELIALSESEAPDVVAIDGEFWRVMRVERFGVLAFRRRAWVERIHGFVPPVET